MHPPLPFAQLLPEWRRLTAHCRTAGRAALLLAALWLTGFAARAQAPANDNPCGAVQLSLNGNLCTAPTVGTNVGATTTTVNGTVANTCGAFNNTAPKDVWYRFTTDATGAGSAGATITVTGNPAGLIRLFSAPSCTGTFTQISCSASNAANTAAPRLVTGALQPSTTYYIQVAGYTSTDQQGQFTICLTDPPVCGAPAVLGVTFPSATSASVTFTPGPGNTTFTAVLQGGPGGQQTVNNVNSPVLFSNLTPGTTYFVSIRTECNGGTLQSPFFSFTVPLLNDDPCGAVSLPISTACSPTTGTTFGASTTVPNGYTNPGCGTDPSPLDVWYQFTTSATGGASTSATITVTGNAAGQVRLFSGASCSGALTQISCSQSPNGPAGPLSSTSLTPNTTYYVQVAGYSDASIRGQFTICVTGASACPDPTNIAITPLSGTSASLSFTPGGNATSYNVTYTPQPGGQVTTVTPAPTNSPVTLTGLTPGTSYTVTLQAVCPAGLGSILTRTYTATSGAPSNDECNNATPITSIGIGTCGTPVTATITGSTLSTGVLAQSCAGTVARDVWFSVVVPSNGILQLETGLAPTGNINDTGMELYSGSCGNLTLIECDDDDSPNGNFSLIRRTGLTPGATLYVRVWRFGTAPNGEFTVCAQTDLPCPNVTNLAVGSIGSTTASLTFTAPAGATSYTVTYTPVGGTVGIVLPAPTASPVNLTGLTPNTNYTVTIQSNCAAGPGLPLALTFTTLPPGPANDDCAGATALTVGTSCANTTVSVVGATVSPASVPAPGCFTGAVNDVWYTLTVPANGIVQVNTSAASGSGVTDTGLALYSGSCGALTAIGCNDNAGANNFSQVRATGLTPGATVYVRAWQVGGTPGTFSICATTDPPCPAPSNLAISAVSTTSATFSFTPPASGTSYTVTYTAAGGQPVTVTPTPTASPVQLTGLTPGTAYTVSIISNCGSSQTSTAATISFTTTSCIPPVNLTVSGITTTAATVAFGIGNGASYTFTYTAQGGSPVTVTPNPTGSPVQLSGLTPGTQYTVSIVSNCGPGQTSIPATTTFTTQALSCNPVTSLAAASVTTTSASITFTPASTSTSYTVTYTAAGGQPVTVTPTPTASPVQLTGLTPGTTYTVNVISSCGAGQTSTTATTTFTTTALPTCNPVTALTATAITTTSANLTFTPAAAGTSYTVTYTAAGGQPQTVTPAPTSSPVTLTSLTPGTTYTVSVVSNCGAGQTSTAATTTFTTQAAPTCPPVTNVAVGSLTSTGASVSFVPGAGNTTYAVTYTAQGGQPVTVTPAPLTSPVTLTGLTPSTQYTVCVTGSCGLQTTAPVCVTFTTPAPPTVCAPVTGLTVGSVTSTTATLSFTPSTTATNYTVTYTAAGGQAQTVTPNPTTSPYVLANLQPNTAYTVSVVSNCAGGTTSTASTATFTTLVTATRDAALAARVGLYPNPTQRTFWLEVPAELARKAMTVTLHNTLGQQVQVRSLPAAGAAVKASFDVSALPRGVYLLHLTTNEGSLVKRLVVE
ncbi:T9SS type A sorting domain-containing protein [Hymenobacter gummosus]|uniref:T9SS type A sorting domain-containing protein n=1 Tax=Hymenobacter gummosus TaxID=1776032 RepID=A0A3S0QDS4_9BACT|nr:fibronectin type III domain-containing protein [Hymenobacter gummosus]RTQ44727.1 T9SS type A sorting domain-containing protein [Hymenobacter gummosus]